MPCNSLQAFSPFTPRPNRGFSNSFTLLELLIVIGIIAVLGSVTFIALNPVETIRASRDTQRFSDLDALNKSVNMAVIENTSTNLGTASTVYVSLPDTSSTCGSWSLPTLPSGWAYHCAASSTYTMTDGTGWLPVNLAALSTGSPISHDPLDPSNDVTHYYQYVPNPSQTTWELASVMESSKYKMGGSNDKTSTDGGGNVSLYEKGTDLTLVPVDSGDQSLVGWWKFDEGSGGTAYDASGDGYNGTISGATWITRKNGYALSFPDPYCCSSKTVLIGKQSKLQFNASQSFSASAWFNPANGGSTYGSMIFSNSWGGPAPTGWRLTGSASGITVTLQDGTHAAGLSTSTAILDTWHLITVSVNRNTQNMTLYLDGLSVGTTNISPIGDLTSIYNFDIGNNDNGNNFNGLIDDVRVYSRALSDPEIQAIYNATK